MNKKAKQNSYKPGPGSPRKNAFSLAGFLRAWLKYSLGFVLVAGMSLCAIWIHDFVVQTPFFHIQKIEVSGNHRISRHEVIQWAGLSPETNLFSIHLDTLEKKITCHPWIDQVLIQRSGFSTLKVSLVEHKALARVNMKNLADLVINTQGKPFKEYDPHQDQLQSLPVISGLELKKTPETFQFEGPVLSTILDLLKVRGFGKIHWIMGDETMGITMATEDIYNTNPAHLQDSIFLKLGFDKFAKKQAQALKISSYMETHLPDKIICAMDLFTIEKVFIKTKENLALHHTIEKGA